MDKEKTMSKIALVNTSQNIEVVSNGVVKELKRFSTDTPMFLPYEAKRCTAFFVESYEEFLRALFNFCVEHRVSINNWQPYYESYRSDFEKFKKEYRSSGRVVNGSYGSPGWYIFQHYTEEHEYYSDKLEGNDSYREDLVDVTSLDYVKSQYESFLSKFEGKK